MSIFKKGFNPILFLDLPEPELPSVKNKLWYELQSAMTEYTCARLLKLLPDNRHESISSVPQLLKIATKELPEFDQKVVEILNDFKTKFKQQSV